VADEAAILERLRSAGGRVTGARRAVVAALLAADDHVTADDLAATVQAADPEIHLSTVYRTLDALERLGVVDHVHLGHGRAVYHLADDPHQHLVCEECGVVIEAPHDLFAEVAERVQATYRFRLRPHHFAVLGRCEDCVRRAAE
jgi:Fe2+ or Zn2+ uptake regulation protein